MRKGTIIFFSIVMILTTVGTLTASAVPESKAISALWGRANEIADASSSYIPGIRRITYQELDSKGNVVYSDQAIALIASIISKRQSIPF